MTAALRLIEPAVTRAVIYARISEDATGEGQGVDRQETACRELADREGWDVADVIVDNDISAYSGKRRPGYERLLTLIESGEVDAVVVYHVDRMYRRLTDLGRLTEVLLRSRVEFRTVAAGHVDLTTASGRFTAQVLAAAAEHESARIGERITMKHKTNAAQGRAPGGERPFGYQRVEDRPGELVVDEAEAELIREAATRVLRGASLNSIVIDWNDRGVLTSKGNGWTPNSLSVMLRAGRIAGLREWHGEVVGEATWPPIIERAVWERVKSKIEHAPVGRRPRVNLLASMLTCGVCGTTMGTRAEGTNPRATRGYRCEKANRGGCGGNSISAERAEEVVTAFALDALAGINLNAARARLTVTASTSLVADIAADEQMLAMLAADAAAKRITPGEWQAMRPVIVARLEENRRKLEQVTADSELDDTAFDHLDADRWAELDLDQKRAVLRLLIDRIIVNKGRRGRGFDPSRVQVVPR